MRSRNAGLAAVLLMMGAACSEPSRTPPASRPSPQASTAVEVSTTAVAGVALGTSAAEADRRLTELLGKPTRRELPGCIGERGHTLTWGRLSASISDGGERKAVVLRGWEVTDRNSGPTVHLPYATAVGQTAAEVRTNVPGAKGEVIVEGPFTGSYVITTPKAPELFWIAKSADGRVRHASYRADVCD